MANQIAAFAIVYEYDSTHSTYFVMRVEIQLRRKKQARSSHSFTGSFHVLVRASDAAINERTGQQRNRDKLQKLFIGKFLLPPKPHHKRHSGEDNESRLAETGEPSRVAVKHLAE